jgi:hypothetical protein
MGWIDGTDEYRVDEGRRRRARAHLEPAARLYGNFTGVRRSQPVKFQPSRV